MAKTTSAFSLSSPPARVSLACGASVDPLPSTGAKAANLHYEYSTYSGSDGPEINVCG